MDQATKLLVRAFGLSRLLLKDPQAVRKAFLDVWGAADGRYLYGKLRDTSDEVDSWWCQLDPANREIFLTAPQLDFSNH